MIVLDTNVVSELARPEPDQRVLAWLASQSPETVYLTTINEAELRAGAMLLPSGRRRDRLSARLDRLLSWHFGSRILPFDTHAARAFAAVTAEARHRGRVVDPVDRQIAAIAYSVGFAVATRNVRHFDYCGLEVIDPWAAA